MFGLIFVPEISLLNRAFHTAGIEDTVAISCHCSVDTAHICH